LKQIAIISGKGGTGKTILTASFAVLAKNKVMVDCDVDAADLHLLLRPTIQETHEFRGLPKAFIDREKCTLCGECPKVCRYEAIKRVDTRNQTQDARYKNSKSNSHLHVNRISCEGCRVCMYICPVKAVSMKDNIAGQWFISKTKYGPMVHAKLGIAEENSGKLVSLVRQNAKKVAQENNLDFVIIDGPPGIGCPVIASLSGIDLAVVITEPTLSGIHDMERVIGLTRHFGVSTACVINKYDINAENTKNIEGWCDKNGVPVYGKIPFDEMVSKSIMNAKPILEYTQNRVTQEVERIWKNLL
jgi:MinD superfamily P-loop ATPase